MANINFDTSTVDRIITGYLPHSIYVFETNTHPNYIKVGDTNRRVETRLNEWRKVYSDLSKKYEAEAMLEDENGDKTIFFRDYAVHDYLLENDFSRLSDEKYESEFFESATVTDVKNGIEDVTREFYSEGMPRYAYYKVGEKNTQVESYWERVQEYKPRPNQEQVIKNIVNAVNNGRKNLLLYAVMRFGKSNVAIWSAKELNSKLTVVVTGKADVKTEWKKTVESHIDFDNFIFADVNGFTKEFIKINAGKNIVLFATLQDLAGSREDVKGKHELLFNSDIDFLVIDESHFGARAKIYSKTLNGKSEDSDFDELNDEVLNGALNNVNSLNSKVKLHLSGTPYRILLSGEFAESDIVGKVQFIDILEAKNAWISNNIVDAEEKPWDNPYFGFPEMIRFAFTPNKSSIKLLKSLGERGESAELNVLFEPDSTKKSLSKTTRFKNEQDVLNLLKAIDGSTEDENIFPFLNYPKIKEGKLAQHVVIVLPYKNSVDAMERLLIENKESFRNLGTYEILNIAGNSSKYKNVIEVQNRIKNFAENNKKTVSLTVNKMLTGSTVPEWDTMVFLKETKSPQEYDQAIFRLQSPWVKEIRDVVTNELIGKEDMKPQTLLIDFSPNRMFRIESERALVVNASEGKSGNDRQEEQLLRNISVSPIIFMNKDRLVEASPTDIIAKIREYSANKSIIDEVVELPIDDSLYSIQEILFEISKQGELGTKSGFEVSANEEGNTDLEGRLGDETKGDKDSNGNKRESDKLEVFEDNKPTVKQMQMYYSRILFYAFLSPENEKNLSNIIDSIEKNGRLAAHLELRKPILEEIRDNINPFILATIDNKIENIGDLRNDATEEDILKSIMKFGRISPSEVFTPIWIAKKMVDDLIDEEFIKEYKENPKNIIDLSSKSGVYLIMVYQKLSKAGIDKDVLKERLFAVPTSHVGFEFTRAVYEEFGWNLENLADSDTLNSYQLISEESVEGKLKELFGGENMKFDVVIGNPPYQKEAKGGSSSDDPIYHLFMDEAYKIADKVSFITPARFLFNAGKTPKDWNNKMLSDKHLNVEYFEQNSAKIFPDIDIKGGVAVTHRDVKKDFGKIGIFTSYKELNTILHKVENEANLFLDCLISGRGVYRLTNICLEENLEIEGIQSKGHKHDVGSSALRILSNIVFFEEKPNDGKDYVQVLGLLKSKRVFYWINRKYLSNPENFEKFKVVVPKANGSGNIGEALSNPLVVSPSIGFTETFISIGAFETEYEANAVLKYIKTKFARIMLGILKITQDNPREKWSKVPLQDFTPSSDIDWSKSISEIDKQLYLKYNLDNTEITFIEDKVISMN